MQVCHEHASVGVVDSLVDHFASQAEGVFFPPPLPPSQWGHFRDLFQTKYTDIIDSSQGKHIRMDREIDG